MIPKIESDLFFKTLVADGKLTVSTTGVVTNLKTGKVIGSVNGGYHRVSVGGFYIQTHRLVWVVYKGVIPEGLLINHKDGNKLNNSLINLELVSYSENNRHAWETGLMVATPTWKKKQSVSKSGVKNSQAKLAEADVVMIRQHPYGWGSDTYLANKLNVSRRTIKLAREGKSFKNI